VLTTLGGLDLSRRGLDRDSRSRHQKSISLGVMDNLDGFQKLVSTIEKSRSRSRNLGRDQEISILSRHVRKVRKVRKVSIETEKSVETYIINLFKTYINILSLFSKDWRFPLRWSRPPSKGPERPRHSRRADGVTLEHHRWRKRQTLENAARDAAVVGQDQWVHLSQIESGNSFVYLNRDKANIKFSFWIWKFIFCNSN
jgi:hypothetical protein